MKNLLYAVYGASGCGRSILPPLREFLATRQILPEQLVFIDDAPSSHEINGHRLLTYEQFLQEPEEYKSVALAIANSQIRKKIALKLERDNISPFSLFSLNSVVMDQVEIGVGALLSPFVTVTSNVKIGSYFHANLYSYVEHDCTIGDFVTFAPRVSCNGNVVIEDHAYIGTGATIRQGRTGSPLVIGTGAVVGMGAVVTKNVPAGVTVVGNPARLLET